MRLLLIEDEAELAEAMASALANHKMVLDHVTSLSLGLEALETPVHDVVILDRNLPDGDGLSFLSRLRNYGNATPVIVLTAYNDLQQRIQGLNEGADDYLGKPFHLEELIARVRAVVRRKPTYPDDVYVAGDVELNSTIGYVAVRGVQLNLPRREHIILTTLMRRPNYVVQRHTLEEAVYGYNDEIQSNALDSHVSRLRKKLTDLGSTRKIVSVRGVGYMLK